MANMFLIPVDCLIGLVGNDIGTDEDTTHNWYKQLMAFLGTE